LSLTGSAARSQQVFGNHVGVREGYQVSAWIDVRLDPKALPGSAALEIDREKAVIGSR
jgi:hypothetical protein